MRDNWCFLLAGHDIMPYVMIRAQTSARPAAPPCRIREQDLFSLSPAAGCVGNIEYAPPSPRSAGVDACCNHQDLLDLDMAAVRNPQWQGTSLGLPPDLVISYLRWLFCVGVVWLLAATLRDSDKSGIFLFLLLSVKAANASVPRCF